MLISLAKGRRSYDAAAPQGSINCKIFRLPTIRRGYTRRAPLALINDKLMGKNGKYRPKVGIRSAKRRRFDNSGRGKRMDLVHAGKVDHGFDRGRRADSPKGVIRHFVVRLDGGLRCR